MIELDQVSKSFKGVPALQNLSLQVGKGEILGLIDKQARRLVVDVWTDKKVDKAVYERYWEELTSP